jgi:hypothetical protein
MAPDKPLFVMPGISPFISPYPTVKSSLAALLILELSAYVLASNEGIITKDYSRVALQNTAMTCLKHYLGIHLEGLRETTRNLGQLFPEQRIRRWCSITCIDSVAWNWSVVINVAYFNIQYPHNIFYRLSIFP